MSSELESKHRRCLLRILLGEENRWVAVHADDTAETNVQRALLWLRDCGPGRTEWPMIGEGFWLEGFDRISDREGVEIFASTWLSPEPRNTDTRCPGPVQMRRLGLLKFIRARCDYFARISGVPHPAAVKDTEAMLAWIERMVMPLAARHALAHMGEDS